MQLKSILLILISFFFLRSTIVYCIELRCIQPIPPACIISDEINASGDEITNVSYESKSDVVYRFEVTKPAVLTSFPQIIFEKFPNIGRVELNEIGLEVLTQQALFKASNLKVLNLRLNKLQTLRNSTFLNVPLLKKLDLSQNDISEIEDDAFNQLNSLILLNLSGNKIKIIKHFTLSGLMNLKHLDLSFNEIEVIEDNALNLTQLTEISLNDNKLKSISDNLFIDSHRVQVIDLSNNQIKYFGKVFDGLYELFFLNLTNNNNLENFSLLKFVHLPELRKLSLDNTGIKFITPPSEEELPKEPSQLIKLSLGNNQLSNADIFKHLIMFPELRGLYLQNNAFTHFDNIEEVKKMFRELRILDLKYNNNNAIQEWVKEKENVLKDYGIEVEV